NDINRYKSDYNYLHIGLVQVAVKALFRKGLDIPEFLRVTLRWAVYFNCYPNFSVDINDPNVMDSLTLNVKTKNLNSKINTR
ncbi:hypothetical protein H5410_003129, partial [Solanum commersonii]